MTINIDNDTPVGYNVIIKFKGGSEMADVTIYTSNTCPYCVAAKNYLDEKGVGYTEKNVQTDKEARKELMAMGHMGVPVLVINGEEVVGFDKPRIDDLLSL